MMKRFDLPPEERWTALCQRPALEAVSLQERIQDIYRQVESAGDEALFRLTRELDGVDLDQLSLERSALEARAREIEPALQQALDQAFRNIETFHRQQLPQTQAVETQPGVTCWQRSVPIERVGLYIPGGTAPLFSSLLMLGIPARLAGCPMPVVCTPPAPGGTVHPALAYLACRLDLPRLYLLGGAQAIAAMALGTASVPAVYKLFGPGNQYVTAAKAEALQRGLAIDMPAGPSEVLVIADAAADPEFVAADLLSQAEHGPDSQVVLLSDDATLIEQSLQAVERQLADLPRAEMARRALDNSLALRLADLDTAFRFSNRYAPEHLILNLEDAASWAGRVTAAGSVFLGPYACESAGDYASGTNHTLPTHGFARQYSGVSLAHFFKTITFQSISRAGLEGLAPAVEPLAQAEGLEAHRRAVSRRLNPQNTRT